MVRRFSILLLIFLVASCEINHKNLIVKKRVYLKGYYVHIPGKRETYPVGYPPPAQYPRTYPTQVADRPDKTTSDSGSTGTYPQNYQPTVVNQYPTNYYYNPNNGNYPSQYPQGGGAGGGTGPGGGVGNGNPNQGTYQPGYSTQQPQNPNQPVEPHDVPIVYGDSMPPSLPTDSAMAYNPPSHNRGYYFPKPEPGVFAQAGLFAATEGYGQQVKWNSFAVAGGLRSKLRINPRHSIVADLGYRFNQFYIGQRAPKLSPLLQDQHLRERVSINEFAGALCDRISLTPGVTDENERWLDVGMYADWSIRTSNVYIDRYQDPTSPIGNNYKVKTKITDLNFLNSWNYGVTARYKFKYCNVFAMYGLNHLIKPASVEGDYRDMPRLIIGVDIDSF